LSQLINEDWATLYTYETVLIDMNDGE